MHLAREIQENNDKGQHVLEARIKKTRKRIKTQSKIYSTRHLALHTNRSLFVIPDTDRESSPLILVYKD